VQLDGKFISRALEGNTPEYADCFLKVQKYGQPQSKFNPDFVCAENIDFY